MLSVELSHIADVLDATHQAQNVSKLARQYTSTITKAIWDHTLVNNVFAYETDGFGSRYVMDDANVPVCFSSSRPLDSGTDHQLPLHSLFSLSRTSAS